MRELLDDELERYSRHVILEDFGAAAQSQLLESSVLIVGAGGLGSRVALYLAAAGVGTIGIVDDDVVDLSNLQRQIIHTTADIDTPKARSAEAKMRAINPTLTLHAHQIRVNAGNIAELIAPYDLVIDGADNFATKFLINDACVLTKKPFVHGGILRFTGQAISVQPDKSACYACLYDAPPPPESVPTCSSAGVLGAIAGMLGTIQAAEAIKILTGVGEPLFNRLLSFDAKAMRFREIRFSKNPKCRVCGEQGIDRLKDYGEACCDL
jgi:molybdopterin/thiamine biosynthesis adenylyltransferase